MHLCAIVKIGARDIHDAQHVVESDTVRMRIPDIQPWILEQKAVDGIGGELALDLLQQIPAHSGFNAVVQRGDQRLEFGIRIAEIVVIARVDIVVQRFGMTHDAHVEVMTGIDLIQPLRPFEIFDSDADSNLPELRCDDFAAAARVAGRRQLQRHREAVRIAGLRQQCFRPGNIVRIHTGQIDIGRIVRRKMTADGCAITEHGAIDDGAPIQGV